MSTPGTELDEVILAFSESDPFTIRDACEGVQIFGASGSGKTSGSGRLFALSYLNAGFGGLVLTAKADEADLWRQYARAAGRTADLIIVGPDERHRFNILDYEWSHSGAGAGRSRNLVELFLTLAEIASRGSAKNLSDNERYWRNELQKLLANSIDTLRLSLEPITFLNLHKIVQSAPRSEEHLIDAEWLQSSFCVQTNAKAEQRKQDNALSPSDVQDFELTSDYWLDEFPRMHDRPRTSITGSFTGMADVFLRSPLRELFSTTTTFTPDDCLDGKIIVLDLPTKKFNEVGIYAQVLFKYCWERAIERRRTTDQSRPVFLWADESQFFVNEHDIRFQSTARGYRAATVFLTQNLPNYHFYLGGDSRAESMTEALIGNLATKIFHNNTCTKTNHYASELFSRTWRRKVSSNASVQDQRIVAGRSYSDELLSEVDPIEFTRLATGGPGYDFVVEGIVHRAGRTFNANGKNHIRSSFDQRL